MSQTVSVCVRVRCEQVVELAHTHITAYIHSIFLPFPCAAVEIPKLLLTEKKGFGRICLNSLALARSTVGPAAVQGTRWGQNPSSHLNHAIVMVLKYFSQ